MILTGGDPLMLSPRRIAEVTAALGAIAHVKVLRWHTRVPVVAPERVTAELVAALALADAGGLRRAARQPPARADGRGARRLRPPRRRAASPMVSQTVLLRGVNDDAETLAALMRAFVEARVKPYYLHHGDLAPGTGHFRTTIAEGQALMRALRGRLSGLAQPTYVLDIPGGHGKVPIGPSYLSKGPDAGYIVEDAHGAPHAYVDCCALPSTGAALSPVAATPDLGQSDATLRDRQGPAKGSIPGEKLHE